MIRTVEFSGLPLVSGPLDAAADRVVELAAHPPAGGALVAHVNLHNRHELSRRPSLLGALSAEGELFFEGIGMQIGLWLSGGPTVESINGTDLFPLVMERAARAGVPVFFVGGSEAVAERAARLTSVRWPALRLAGFCGGFFREIDEPRIVSAIAASGARLVLVARGCPKQEEFSLRWRRALAPAVLWSVGGLLDFVSGRAPRAPESVRAARLEWLYRIGREPRRMWRRALVEPPLFLLDVARGLG
jgi:exopolysaccharide biosynthesis WecB/TagA/CpsF family protein